MTFRILDRDIDTVQLIDDSPTVRSTYRLLVEDLDAEPDELEGGIKDIFSVLNRTNDKSAVICDYNLTVRNYSKINGDVIVSGLYESRVPAVLCTRLEGHFPDAIRRRRRFIPVILPSDEVNPSALHEAFQICAGEYRDEFRENRQPWQTMIRIEGGELLRDDLLQVNVVIPEWSSDLLSFEWEIGSNDALQKVKTGVQTGEVVRIYATVNVGAEQVEELYVTDWSTTVRRKG